MKNPQKSKTLRALQTGLLASTLLAAPAFGAPIAYEGFQYTQANGTSIVGLNGGTGWTEAFPSTDGAISLADGLSFTGIAPTPGKSIQRPAGATLGSNGRNWAASAATGTYWYSFLINRAATASNVSRGTFGVLQGPGTNQNGFGIRFDFTGTVGPTATLTFLAHSPSQATGDAKTFTSGGWGQTYLVLGRLTVDTAANTTNDVWVYQNGETVPSSEGSLPAPMSSVSGSSTGVIPAMYGRAFGDSAANAFDEVRIGTTFVDAFPPATLVLSPNTGVEGRNLTFTWENIPASVTAMELDPGNIPLTPSAAGTHGPIPTPAANTTYTLTYTVGGIDSTLTQNFTAIPPTFTLAPATAYPGQTLTFNWFLPIGSSAILIDNGVGTGTIDATGAGFTTLAAPSANTTYTLTYTFNSTVYTLTQNFTLSAPFVDVSPSQAVEDTTPLVITWRVPVGVTAVTLKSGPTGGPYSTPVDVLTTFTNAATGAGALTPNPLPLLTTTEYVLEYTLGTNFTLSDTLEVFPKIFTSVIPSGTALAVQVNPAPMNNGVLAYSDRGHVWASVPTVLQGAQFVKFAQNDKENATLSVQFTAAKKATFFLLLDNRIGDGIGGTNPAAGTDNPPTLGDGVMDWVLSSGFVDSGVDIGLDENPSGPTTIDQSYSVFFRQVEAGEIFTFLAQNDGGARNMYGIAGVAPQVVPVTFFANPAAINSNMANSTQLNWTVPANVDAVSISPPPPGTEPSGNVLGNTTLNTGVGFVNVFPTTTTTYTLTYDPQGVSPPVILPPLTVHVNELTATPSEYTVGGSTTLGWKIPPGSTNVLINGGVGDVTADTLPTGIGSKAGVTAGVGSPSYTLTYIAPGATTTTTVGPVSVTVLPIPTTPFEDWMSASFPGITAPNNAAGADPDGDGLSNFGEFAFSGNPGSGSDAGIIRSAIDDISGTKYLTLTFACRSGASFTGAGPALASQDGVDYTVRASLDLSTFTVGLDEVTPAIATGLPDPAPDGYEYRTFRVTTAQPANPKAFMQAVAEPTP